MTLAGGMNVTIDIAVCQQFTEARPEQIEVGEIERHTGEVAVFEFAHPAATA